MKLLEIEDYLQINCEVFESGFNSNRTAHMDAYMTVINYDKLYLALHNCPFSKKEMLEAADNWGSSVLSPIHKLLSLYVIRHYKK